MLGGTGLESGRLLGGISASIGSASRTLGQSGISFGSTPGQPLGESGRNLRRLSLSEGGVHRNRNPEFVNSDV